jgi:NTE family protein
MRSVKIWKDEIPKDKFRQYMLASASFPGLMSMSIDGKRYMDGGVADNMPVSMLRERGYTDIIAVDIRNPYASRRKLKASGANIIHVRNNRSLGSPFDMTPSVIGRNRTLGYLDTLKAFGELQGEYFYFTKQSYIQLHQEFYKYIAGLEYAGLASGLPREKKYTADAYLDALRTAREQAQNECRILRRNTGFDILARALAHKDSAIVPIPDAKWIAMVIELLCDSKASTENLLRIPMRSARRISNAAQFIQDICR